MKILLIFLPVFLIAQELQIYSCYSADVENASINVVYRVKHWGYSIIEQSYSLHEPGIKYSRKFIVGKNEEVMIVFISDKNVTGIEVRVVNEFNQPVINPTIISTGKNIKTISFNSATGGNHFLESVISGNSGFSSCTNFILGIKTP
jgi:hypothetical protein